MLFCALRNRIIKIRTVQKQLIETLLKKRLFQEYFFTEHLCWLLLRRSNRSNINDSSQATFTCSKSKIKTLEKGVKHIQSLVLTLKIFHFFSGVYIVDFEQVNVSCVNPSKH